MMKKDTMIKRILVGLTGATPPTTTERAIELAVAHEATVTAVTVANLEDSWREVWREGWEDDSSRDDRTSTAQRIIDRRAEVTRTMLDESISRFESSCRDAGVKHRVLVEKGASCDVLIEQARYHDLSIVSLQALFDHKVVADPRDTLVRLVRSRVRPILASVPGLKPIRKVLVAYSGSMESANAMKRFVQLRPFGIVNVRLVCFEQPEEGMKLLEDAAEYCETHGFPTEIENSPLAARVNLLPYADRHGADLIILGNSERTLVLRYVMGSTFLEAIRESKVPLFVAP